MTQRLQTMASDVGALLKETGQTVGVAESSTGGLISSALLCIAGASAYYAGGAVVYTMQSRRKLLGMRRSDLEGLKPLTVEVAAVFAAKARETFESTWGIAELGAAGPSGTRYGHPPGLSVIAVDGPVCLAELVETGSGDREANMWEFSRRGLLLLKKAASVDLPTRGAAPDSAPQR